VVGDGGRPAVAARRAGKRGGEVQQQDVAQAIPDASSSNTEFRRAQLRQDTPAAAGALRAMERLTEAGLADPLFRGLPPVVPVFQWHGDTFAIPAGGSLLATGSDCRNQAFRHGNSWGLQFHLEADRSSLAAWFAGTPPEREVLRRHDELAPRVNALARALFDNFLREARRARQGA